MKPSFRHQLNQIFSLHGHSLFDSNLCAYSAHVNAFRLKSSKVNFVFCKLSPQADSIPAIQKRRTHEKTFAFSRALLSLLCDGHSPFLYFQFLRISIPCLRPVRVLQQRALSACRHLFTDRVTLGRNYPLFVSFTPAMYVSINLVMTEA